MSGAAHVGALVFVGLAVTGALEGLAVEGLGVLGAFVGVQTGGGVGQP